MDTWCDDQWSDAERARLAPFVTNLDRSVFGLQGLPEVVKGALFARYSRSDRSLRRLLLDEFLGKHVHHIEIPITSQHMEEERRTAAVKAEAFYERVLIGYGDDSVAELGGAHIACEGISNIAAKVLEDSRIGLSPLEKSTRYVPFDRMVGGRYRYIREPAIMASPIATQYETAMDRLFTTYSSLIAPITEWVRAQTPRDSTTSPRAYANATRARALDMVRGLLPMATLTNVGLFGNGRAFEYLLVRLAASPHEEIRLLGRAMQQELDMIIPSFVKRARTERGAAMANYLATTRDHVAERAQVFVDRWDSEEYVSDKTPRAAGELCRVQLVEFDPDAETKIIAAILYPHTHMSLADLRAHVQGLSAEERRDILRAYVGDRESRFHRPGRAFEEAWYVFDLCADLGAYRDLQRHRLLTQERQHYTTQHGYIIPEEIDAAGFRPVVTEALEHAADIVRMLARELPHAAQYAIPFAFLVRWRITLNLREAYHLIELRSSRQGHPHYRAIVHEMYRQMHAVHPSLLDGMTFVDMGTYALERLAAEQRIAERAEQQHERGSM